MKPTARSKGFVKLNPEDNFYLRNIDVEHKDFSNKKADNIGFVNSRFKDCKFENIRAEVWCFGSGPTMTEYINCSFDNSVFASPVVGNARFVNCSFRNVKILQFFAHNAEFVNCIFSGKLKKALFFGRPLEDRVEKLGRKLNEFTGNDFSELVMSDIDFRKGIDLTKQKLPEDKDYLYIEDSKHFTDRAKEITRKWIDAPLKKEADVIFQIQEKKIADGQKQLFFVRKDMEPEIFELFKSLVEK